MGLPTPIEREEMYLSNIAGQGTTIPDRPISRTEEYLDAIAKGGGGGGSAALESDVTANTNVGAISSGTTIPQGTSFTEFAQKLLISENAITSSMTTRT